MYTIGLIPTQDDEYLRVLELAGKRIEDKEGILSQLTRSPNKQKYIKIRQKIRYKIKKRKNRQTIRIMKGVKSKKETRRKNSCLNLRL
jgi:hypothetical protein